MKDRSLLVLLVLTVAFILYVKPARQNIDLLRTQIIVLDSQLAAQENIKRQSKDIATRLKETGAVAAVNEGYLYPVDESNSLALVDLQDLVKRTASANRMEVLTSVWGEPTADPKSGLIRIPMTFMVKGLPDDLDAFLQKLFFGQRFIKAERATITKFQDQQLVLNLSLVAFKRDSKRE